MKLWMGSHGQAIAAASAFGVGVFGVSAKVLGLNTRALFPNRFPGEHPVVPVTHSVLVAGDTGGAGAASAVPAAPNANATPVPAIAIPDAYG
jgi:hypothetical protein